MSTLGTLRLWFATFAEDQASARSLWSESATLHAVDGGFTGGFDDLLAWYARRREREGPGFSWRVEDLLGGERYAAAIIRLVSDARPEGWEQHAVYEVSEGKIRQVWLHEPQAAKTAAGRPYPDYFGVGLACASSSIARTAASTWARPVFMKRIPP